MKIELQCKTGGFSYGEVVEVGTKKGEIDKKTAQALLKEGHAVVVDEKVTKNAKDLLAENKRLQDENDALKEKLAALEAKNDAGKEK